MKTLFQKLKLENQKEILIINEPDGFSEEFAAWTDINIIESLIQVNKVDFALLFVTSITELENQLQTLLPKLDEDAVLWIAHPRKVSSTFKTDIDDRYQWKALFTNCYELVDRLKVNGDWEAVRFRKMEYLHCKEKAGS